MKKAVVFLLIGALGAWCQNPELLVLLKGANALAFYTWAGELVASAPVGTHPHEMVQSPDGKFAYVTDNGTMRIEHAGAGGNTVSIVDIAKQRLAARISLGKYHRPHGIDLDPATNRL
ncbi:MAG: hypothetical protein GY953_08335, partial [bacterium]|nr:hypothetical protein [bacterium]